MYFRKLNTKKAPIKTGFPLLELSKMRTDVDPA